MELKVGTLIAGLLALAGAGFWLLTETTSIDGIPFEVVGPVLLILAGIGGLVAALWKGRTE